MHRKETNAGTHLPEGDAQRIDYIRVNEYMFQAMDTERANLMFRAFADETRLRILSLLRKDEICVGDLVEILQVPQPTASRHLASLRKAGLVESRKDGLWVFYALATPTDTVHRALIRCLEGCFKDIPQLKSDVIQAKRVKQSGGCCRR